MSMWTDPNFGKYGLSSFQNIQKSTCLIENFATKIWKKYHFWRKLKNKVQYFFKFWSSGFTRRPRKFGVIFHFHQIQVEDNSEFCGLLRKSKLYQKMSKINKFQSQKSADFLLFKNHFSFWSSWFSKCAQFCKLVLGVYLVICRYERN